MEPSFETNVNAISGYAHACGKTQLCGIVKVYAEAYVDGELVVNKDVECFFGSDGYGHPQVSVDWNLNKAALKRTGLHPAYNPCWQVFEYTNNYLKIQSYDSDEDYQIYLYLPD